MEQSSIEILLAAWGRWAIRVETKSIGYASVSPMFREARFGNGFGSAPPVGINDADLRAVDAAVQRLPVILRATLNEFYKSQCSIRDLALHLGCSRPSASQYLNEARRRIAQNLEEMDVT
jgi:DNA-directed RNA polymerase specialized sigma24 family protein